MDLRARTRLMEEIANQKKQGGELAVPLDLFFHGNDDLGSIGCNLGDEQPPIHQFYRTLTSLRDRSEVQDIWVRITDASDPSGWPHSDTIYVISSLPQADVEAALAQLLFDEVSIGWMYGKPAFAPDPKGDFAAYSVCGTDGTTPD